MTTLTKSKKSILPGVLFEVAMIGSFAAWQLQGLDGARNVFLFMAWALSLITIIASIGWINDKDYPDMSGQPWLWKKYIAARTPLLLGAIIWFDLTGLAVAFATAWLLIKVAQHTAKAANGGAA